MFTYIINRLKEISTYQGLVVVLTAIGLKLSPEQANAIASAGIAIFSAISVLLPQGADAKK